MRRTITTAEAAYLLQLDPRSLARKMRQLGIEPERKQRIGRSTVTVWELRKIQEAAGRMAK